MHTRQRALVTGGAGFIGSHLVDRLLDDGCHVTVIDNYSTGRPQNLAHRAGHPALAVHQLAIEDHDAIRPLFDGVSWVFHMAALADIVPSIQRPLDYYRANVTGTASVVQAASGIDSQLAVDLNPNGTRPRFTFHDGEYWVHGLNLGLTWRY